MKPEKVVWIAGVARSGTSWIGQIFNSHPEVRFRFQPLFSYEFKSQINEDSSGEEYQQFFRDLYAKESPFLTQADKVASGEYPDFQKHGNETALVFKENRYLSTIEPMLRRTPCLKVVGVIRDPSAVIHSWSRNEREFPRGSVLREQWRFGQCKNEGSQDYFGFYKWKEAANLFMDLVEKYPEQMLIVKYEQLTETPIETVASMLRHCGLALHRDVECFLNESGQQHSDSYYSVYKSATEVNGGHERLDSYIVNEIRSDLVATRLERFLAD